MFRIRFHLFDEVVEPKSCMGSHKAGDHQVVGLRRACSFWAESSNNSVDAFCDVEDVENVIAWVPDFGIEVFNSCRVDDF